MLDSFHIDGPFLGFEDFHIKGLQQFNLIVGKNGVGKSALLEAIRVNHQGAQMICAADTRCYPHMPWTRAFRAYPQDFLLQRIILIDEIETGLHYTVHSEVWKEIYDLCRDNDVQIIATTNSLEMIRAAHEVMYDHNCFGLTLFRIERQAYLTHRVIRYDHPELAKALAKEEEIR